MILAQFGFSRTSELESARFFDEGGVEVQPAGPLLAIGGGLLWKNCPYDTGASMFDIGSSPGSASLAGVGLGFMILNGPVGVGLSGIFQYSTAGLGSTKPAVLRLEEKGFPFRLNRDTRARVGYHEAGAAEVSFGETMLLSLILVEDDGRELRPASVEKLGEISTGT